MLFRRLVGPWDEEGDLPIPRMGEVRRWGGAARGPRIGLLLLLLVLFVGLLLRLGWRRVVDVSGGGIGHVKE